ncbi:hemerythrin domain-containing protein [Myxococcota bacterium]|nr:hemerythrin domain-containing protein [Myxococcota bacterium]
MTLQARVQHVLDTHHALLHRELPRLDQALRAAPAPLRRAWTALSPLLRDHLHKEEVLLFPAILAVARGEAAAGCGILGPIRQMEHEHEQIRALEAELRALLPQAGAEAEALAALLDDLAVHAATEDDQVFPLALAGLAALLEPDLVRVGQVQEPGLAEVCAVALEDHARMRRALAELERDPALAHLPAFAIMAGELRRHVELEERRLYPALFALARGRLHAPVEPDSGAAWLSILHELPLEERAAADWLRAVQGGVPERPAALDALLAAIATHAALEVHQVFPQAMQALGALPAVDEAAPAAPAPPRGQVLRQTRGRCSTCLEDVPAEVVRTDDEVRLVKRCAEHGETSELLSRAPEYWADLDRFYFQVNGEEWPQRDFMIRMTEKCNLDCPICLAKANTEETPDLDLSGLQALLSERRGIKVDLLAAEPTLREDLPDWIRKVKASGNIAALHTNGIKLADAAYARTLAEAGVDEVFLQFDGFDDDAHMQLRGARLLRRRMQALANLRELGIATSLIVVIAKDLNEDQVGRVYRFALQPENSHVREVFFLGLRVLGSTRYAQARAADGQSMADRALMPDALIDVLCAQEPSMKRQDIQRFNKLYFSMLSAFKVRKCLYVQHYLVARDGAGGARTAAELLPLDRIEQACEAYARRLDRHPHLARARFLAELARLGVRRETLGMLFDMVQLQALFKTGMALEQVPRRFLLLGFITACDPQNFDAQVAVNCGKGELSVDGGFVDSGAVANVEREARFDESERRPGQARKRRER